MKALSRLYTILILAFMYAPILVLIVFSFNSSNSTSVFEGFSLKWYEELFKDAETLKSLYNTLILAVMSAIISTVLGTAAAVGISYMKKGPIRSIIMTLTNIPMMNADIVTGVSLMLLFVFGGSLLGISGVLGFGTLLIAHVTFNLPYVILSVLPKLKQLDPHLSEAAQDLGCTPLKSFFKVVVPSILPGIISGMMMAFTLSIDDFVVTNYTTSTSFDTLSTFIYKDAVKGGLTPSLRALSTLIFVVVLTMLFISNFRASKEKTKEKKA